MNWRKVTHASSRAVCLCLTTSAQADVIRLTTSAQDPPVATQNFFDTNTPTADGSPNGDINTAVTFVLGSLFSGGANSGVFAGMPTQSFGSVPFDVNIPTSLTFGNSVFGTFTSTSIVNEGGPPGFVNIVVVGDWTPGSFGGLMGQGPFESQLKIAFTQNPANIGTISASATFATPVPIIPEPSTVLMTLTGLGLAVVSPLRRRRS